MVTRNGSCEGCGRAFFYTVPSWRGKGRKMCDDCKKQKTLAQNADRQRRFRLNHKKPKQRQFVMHIQGCDHKYYCGKPVDHVAAGKWFVEHEGRNWRYCKTCFAAFARETGIEVNK